MRLLLLSDFVFHEREAFCIGSGTSVFPFLLALLPHEKPFHSEVKPNSESKLETDSGHGDKNVVLTRKN